MYGPDSEERIYRKGLKALCEEVMKRFFCLILTVIALFTAVPNSVIADANSEEDPFKDITTPYLMLMEAETGTVVYERRGYEKAFPASTTKLMTAVLTVENIENLDRIITVSTRAVSGFGSTSSMMKLKSGEQIAIIDVLYGLLMRSGNDAAKCLAITTVDELYGGSVDEANAVEKFAELMNEKAAEIGMKDTHFVTVDGRHNDEHYTTAYDFALLMQYVLKNEKIREIISTPVHDVEPNNMHSDGYHMENSNKLICMKENDTADFRYPYCIGGKTGETNQAGFCLASASQKDGVTLILIQFGDNNSTQSTTYRYKVAKEIYDWGFSNYGELSFDELGLRTEFTIKTQGYSPLDEQGGMLDVVADTKDRKISGAMSVLSSIKTDPNSVRIELHVENAIAPIKEGDVVGTADYYINGTVPITVNLIAKRSVAASDSDAQSQPSNIPISNTPPPGNNEIGKLRHAGIAGGSEYSVWVYYDNSLYNMTDSAWYYIYCSDGKFRVSSAPEVQGGLVLYKQFFDSEGNPYYSRVDSVGDGGIFIVTSNGYALSCEKVDGTLKAVKIEEQPGDTIISGVPDEVLWTFVNEGNGYKISQSSKFLTRDPGSGMVFWIVVATALLLLTVLVIMIAMHNRPGRRGRYRRSRSRSHRRTYRSRGRGYGRY